MIPVKVVEFSKKYWPLLVTLLIGVGIGWGVKPSQVQTIEKVKTVEVEKKDTRIDELLTQISTLNHDYQEMKNSQSSEKLHTTVVEAVAKDGSKTKTTTVDKNTDTTTTETKHDVEVKVVTVEKQVVVVQTVTTIQTVEKEKIVTPVLPKWHIGILGGLTPQFLPIPGAQNWIVGGEIEHRFIGPIFLGVWGAGTTTRVGMGGLKLGMEF